MTVLKEYIEQVLTELARDEKFIKTLKAARVHQAVPVVAIEKLADEWAAMQRGLKPEEVRIARRLAIEHFPTLYDKFRGDQAAAKKALFSMLSSFMSIKASIKKRTK